MAEDTISAVSPSPLPKYSRYRSVRQQAAAAKSPPPPQPTPEQKVNQDVSITRSMSRYRRPKVVPKSGQISSPPVPPVPSLPTTTPYHSKSMTSSSSGARDWNAQAARPAVTGDVMRGSDSEKISQYQPRRRQPDVDKQGFAGTIGGDSQGDPESESLQSKTTESRDQEGQERATQPLPYVATEAPLIPLVDDEGTARLLAEQKRKDLERLEVELAAAPPALPKVASPTLEKFNLFARKRSATIKASSPTSPTIPSGPITASIARTISNETPRGIEQGGGGIVPGTDAPISAVNAGERRVLIRCKQSSINLPITPETTPVDLIYSAANIMSHNITPSTAILLESYTQLGLERRLRRYEHIRDIMNSWDRDTQNALILQSSDSPNHDHDLDTSSVPRDRPKDVTVCMYHSQKPGKWNRRYITLLSSGQIFTTKKPNGKISDKDALSICHLSDFDIYTPTPPQIRKTLKPPKKYCYAIKSQQKTVMFLSTENFVHFFSVDEEPMADKWYSAVQRWRSWYLVNQMGEGNKNATSQSKAFGGKPDSTSRSGATLKSTVNDAPYTIGSFTPLLNLDRFGSPSEPEYDSEEENRPRQVPFHLRNRLSMSSVPSRRERHPPPVAYRLPPEAEGEFDKSGLLGRSYTVRQRAMKERETKEKQAGAFADMPSFLNEPYSPDPEQRGSFHSAKIKRPHTSAGPETSTGLQRNPTKREKPKPLLDFTPQFKEPPQWDKTGKGHGVAPIPGVPLVDVATTPESGLSDMPKAIVFRRDARPATAVGGTREREKEGAFIKGGLVSGNGYGGSSLARGRVVSD